MALTEKRAGTAPEDTKRCQPTYSLLTFLDSL
jgi:hypothetical protein